MKRVFLIVLDSLGIGEAPDAQLFSDVGANTLKRISASDKFNIPTLTRLGIGNVDGVDYIKKCDTPLASTARLREISLGKDTTVGHWEIAGIISPSPLPTYPNGFPSEIIDEFTDACGRGVLCNKPYSGTDVIRDYGDEHIKSGKLIVYTSADSVFQIAAHENVLPLEKLYEYCAIARKILTGKHGVGRVIARPFITENGSYKRSAGRRDFSLPPPSETLLDILKSRGLDVISVGKIKDIFADTGITESYISHSNKEGMGICSEIVKTDFHGLCFVNLVDFDMIYGHRQNVEGYAEALSEFDAWLAKFIDELAKDDALIITADHGCDPGDTSTDHTREYVPFLLYSKSIPPKKFGTIDGFAFVSDTVKGLLL